MQNHPTVRHINLRLDNDLAGRKACEVISEKYKNQGYRVDVILPRTKDYNEDLCRYAELHNMPDLPLRLPVEKENNVAYTYLTEKLGISPEIVTTLINKNYICSDKNNISFVGHNKAGAPAYSYSINTNDNSVSISGVAKNSFYIKGYDKSKVIVYKSPIDLLADATMSNIAYNSKREWLNSTRLSLCGTDDTALQNFLSENPEVKQVCFSFGGKEIDIETGRHFLQKYSEKGYACTRFESVGESVTEELSAMIQQNIRCNTLKK